MTSAVVSCSGPSLRSTRRQRRMTPMIIQHRRRVGGIARMTLSVQLPLHQPARRERRDRRSSTPNVLTWVRPDHQRGAGSAQRQRYSRVANTGSYRQRREASTPHPSPPRALGRLVEFPPGLHAGQRRAKRRIGAPIRGRRLASRYGFSDNELNVSMIDGSRKTSGAIGGAAPRHQVQRDASRRFVVVR